MKPTFYLLYNQFFSYSDNKQRKIGGIETYIERLALLVVKMGYQAVVCQFSEEPYEKEYEGFVVRGYCRPQAGVSVQIICKFSNERMCTRKKDAERLSCGFEDNEASL